MWAMVIGSAAGLSVGVTARERPAEALPGFTVTTPSGDTVISQQLSTSSQWLLVYLDPVTAPNRKLLGLLKALQTPQLVARVVLVINGKPADANAWLARELGDQAPPLAWFADADGSAAKALKATGTPMLLCVREGQVEWTLVGVLSRPESLESIVRTWVETARNDRP